MTSRVYPLLLQILVLLPGFTACDDDESSGPPDLVVESTVATPDGIDLYYRIYGEPLGEDAGALVFLHGGPGEHMQWYVRDFEFLARERAVIYYDQRGGGRSELPADTTALTIQHHIADLEAFRAALGLERMTLVGHSFGPAVAALYAIAHPERVDRMLFIGPIPPRLGNFFAEYVANLTARFSPDDLARSDELEMIWATTGDLLAVCEEYWALGIAARLADPATSVRLNADPCDASTSALRYARVNTNPTTFGSLGEWDWLEDLADLNIPTLVIHGEEEAIPMAMIEEWATAMPDARLLRVPDAGHFPYAERPEITIPAIEQFLDGEWPADAETLD